jgi:hypothetical protein
MPPQTNIDHKCTVHRGALRRPCMSIVDSTASIAPSVDVIHRRAGVWGARLSHVGKVHPLLWLNELPPLAAFATSDAVDFAVALTCMPRDDRINRWIILVRHDVGGANDGFPAVTKESVDFCHHSTPQQAGQVPFRWFGLHLSRFSPHTRADSGAMCLNCSRGIVGCVALAACSSKHWRTKRLKLGSRSAMRAVCSSRLMVLFGAMTLRHGASICMYVCVCLA